MGIVNGVKTIIFGICTFGIGCVSGIAYKQKMQKKQTTYSGTLEISDTGGNVNLYLVLDVPPMTLLKSADATFKISKIKVK